jgi:peroxiredoxin Q/BCP
MLKVGDRAPDFSAVSTDGKPLSLAGLKGKKVIVYFYPKAFTPGCTAETCQFRDSYENLVGLGAEVIGISVDGQEKQRDFAAKHELKFPLIADADKSISRAFGVLWPIFAVAKRVTFIINEEGVIQAVLHHELMIGKHLEEVRSFLQKR